VTESASRDLRIGRNASVDAEVALIALDLNLDSLEDVGRRWI
jgi:hypothetical protein